MLSFSVVLSGTEELALPEGNDTCADSSCSNTASSHDRARSLPNRVTQEDNKRVIDAMEPKVMSEWTP